MPSLNILTNSFRILAGNECGASLAAVAAVLGYTASSRRASSWISSSDRLHSVLTHAQADGQVCAL